MSEEVDAVWVVGSFKGDQAKKVSELADNGVGYITLERGGNRFAPEIVVAFRFVLDGEPIPNHLSEVRDPFKIAEYEKIRRQRSGQHHSKEVKA